MKNLFLTMLISALCALSIGAQEIIPLDTAHWNIRANAHVFENYKGKNAVYIQGGVAALKNTSFLNGTIEFDVYLTERESFPGVYFRATNPGNCESFFLRPHLSGKPDANQAAPRINGLTPWQLYFGPRYSFQYDYNFNGWTHIKLVVHDDKAQVFLDYADKPHLSWDLVHTPQNGGVMIGGSFAPMHYANFSLNPDEHELVDFNPIERAPFDDLIAEWQLSDMFEERLLDDPTTISTLIQDRKWGPKIEMSEGVAGNIATEVQLFDGTPGNTVFAKVIIHSDRDQIKLLDFGYSDRVVAVLNGQAIYRGNNKWRSRDYRYLGTIGLFDAIYLNLKKGDNELLLAVSEDFGGWLVTGRLNNYEGITLKYSEPEF